jgi:hypothetical protein
MAGRTAKDVNPICIPANVQPKNAVTSTKHRPAAESSAAKVIEVDPCRLSFITACSIFETVSGFQVGYASA